MRPGNVRPKPLKWVGSARNDLLRFPDVVRKETGYALYLAQLGMKSPKAKPLRGFGGGGVLEVVEDYRGDTYRAVYTVKFRGIVFALHTFQKKSVRGRQTPKSEIEIVKARLRAAAAVYEELYRSEIQ